MHLHQADCITSAFAAQKKLNSNYSLLRPNKKQKKKLL